MTYAFGAIDLFAGSGSFSGTNNFMMDKNPLNVLSTDYVNLPGIVDTLEMAVSDVLSNMPQLITEALDFLITIPIDLFEAMLGIFGANGLGAANILGVFNTLFALPLDFINGVLEFLGFDPLPVGSTNGSIGSVVGAHVGHWLTDVNTVLGDIEGLGSGQLTIPQVASQIPILAPAMNQFSTAVSGLVEVANVAVNNTFALLGLGSLEEFIEFLLTAESNAFTAINNFLAIFHGTGQETAEAFAAWLQGDVYGTAQTVLNLIEDLLRFTGFDTPFGSNPNGLPAQISRFANLITGHSTALAAINVDLGTLFGLTGTNAEGLAGIINALIPNISFSLSSLMSHLGLNDIPSLASFLTAIDPAFLPLIPASHIVNINPELLLNPGFDSSSSITAGVGFTFDDTTGHGSTGSAKTVAAGAELWMLSNPIAVAAGDELAMSIWVQWSSLTTSGSSPAPIRLQVQPSGLAAFPPATLAGRGALSATARATKFTLPCAVAGYGSLTGLAEAQTPGSNLYNRYGQPHGRGVLSATATKYRIAAAAPLAGRGVLSASVTTTPGNYAEAPYVLASIASPGSNSGWIQLAANYTVPVGANTVCLQPLVDVTATGGTIWFDDGSVTKAGVLAGGNTLVDVFSNLLTGLFGGNNLGTELIQDVIPTLTAEWSGSIAGTALRSWSNVISGLGAMAAADITALLTSWTDVFTALGSFTSDELTSILSSWSDLYTALGSFGSTVAADLLGSWSTLVTGLGSFSAADLTGALNTGVTFLVGASNIALSTLLQNLSATGTFAASALTGAINTAVSISGNAISTLFNGSGLIASQISGALNTAVTISGNAISSLFNGSGVLASALTGALNTAVTLSGSALSALFDGSAKFIGAIDSAATYASTALSTVFTNITPSTGALAAAGLSGALNSAVTLGGNAISTLFNGSGVIASQIAGALNPAVTFLVGASNIALSTLLQNLSATGTLVGSAVTGALNSAVTLGGNAVSALFNGSGVIASQIAGALNTAVTISGNALSALFNGSGVIASQIAGALNTAVTISGNALSALFNGSGVLASALTGAINTAVTISGNAVSALFNGSGLIASQIAGALNTAVTISGNAVSTLFNSSGVLASALTGALNTAVTISGNALSTLFNSSGVLASALTGAINTAVTISGNAVSTLFNGSGVLASALTGAFNTAVTISGNAISTLFNGSGVIASQIAGALNPAVTFLVGASNIALSTLFGNINATGQFLNTAVTNALGSANLGADVQAIVDKVTTTLNPILSTGNPLTAITTQIQNMFGGFLPAVVDNLDGTITTLTGFTNNSDGTLSLTPALNDIHTMVDNLDGTITSAATALQNMFFGTKSTGASATAAINHSQDVVTNTNGLTVVAAATPANTAADVAKALAGNSIVSSSSAAPWSAGTGVTYSRTWSDYPNSATFPTDFTEVSGNGGSMSLNGGFAVAAAAPVVAAYAAMYHFNAGVTSTDFQIIQGVWASNIGTFGLLSSTAAGGPYLRGRASPSTFDCVDVLYESSNTGSSSSWVLDYTNSGLSRDSTLGYFSDTFTPFAQYSLICGVGGNRRSFALLKNGVPLVPTASGDGTLSGNTLVDGSAYTALGASYRSGGLGYAACQLSMVEWVLSDYVPALLATSVGDFYINSGPTIEDVVLPTSRDFVAVQGVDLSAFSLEIPATSSLEITGFAEQYQLKSVQSGLKASRASASTGAVVANGTISIWNTTENLYLFPASFFDTPSLLTGDMIWNSTTNTITVTRTGWYLVEVASGISITINSTFIAIGVYKNGVMQSVGTLNTNAALNIGAVGSNQGTFIVDCKANDTLTPGYVANQSFNLYGDPGGVSAHFKVTPMNCGIITG